MRGEKCQRSTCSRIQDSGGYCRHHRAMLRALGQAGMFDVAKTKAHLQALAARGVSLHWMARESGVGFSTVWRIFSGGTTRSRAATLRALLALRVEDALAPSVDSLGTRRRVQALIRIGWPYAELTRRTGLGATTLRKVIYRERISRALADKVAAVYSDLARTPGASKRAVTLAIRKGFVSPAAWDDDTIDDPSAHPNLTGYDEETVRALVAGRRLRSTPQDRQEATLRLVTSGMTPEQAAFRLGAPTWVVLNRLGRDAA